MSPSLHWVKQEVEERTKGVRPGKRNIGYLSSFPFLFIETAGDAGGWRLENGVGGDWRW
jgi:hypothetical protein